MDLIDKLTEISNRIPKIIAHLETEEATKNALVMPFISALGYDVFNPHEVVPEFTADVGTKKGEKVDYAVLQAGKPIILFECKSVATDLDKITPSQLYRYFSVTEARFGILTNGIEYRLFSDLESPNKMDSRPFLEFRLEEVNEDLAGELKKFAKETFDLDSILSTASELKYLKGIKRILAEEWVNPSEELVRMLAGRVYSGRMTEAVRDQFTDIARKAFHQFVSDRVNKRLKSALQGTSEYSGESQQSDSTITAGAKDDRGVNTTEDELEAFYVVKSIVRQVVDVNRVFMRDTQSYCGILLDDNNRKPICRLFFNTSQKYLGILDEEKNVARVAIAGVNDLYRHADEILAAVQRYLGDTAGEQGAGAAQ